MHRGGVGIDPGAVEAYEKHASDLVVYATALVGPSDAEDVVAEAVRVDLAPAAAADLLGLSEGAVKRYLARARAKLRKGLTP